MHYLILAFLALFLAPGAQAACPKNKKAWQKLGPKFLVESAASKSGAAGIPNFSEELSKKGAQAKAFPYKEKKNEFVLVEVKHPSEPIYLSGIMKCDPATKQPVLLSLTWVKGDKSGLVKLH